MTDRPFDTLSGPWTGWSIQDGFRLSERMSYTIGRGGDGRERFGTFAMLDAQDAGEDVAIVTMKGWGTDSDGDFTMEGFFDPSTSEVHLVRRYVRAPKNPGQVGYPFLYEGKWNGYCIHGTWMDSTQFDNCGPFEMWPDEAEEVDEIMLEELPRELALPSRSSS